MNSIWTNDASYNKFEALNGNIKVDVLIVGGGIAGILCAYMLKNAGVDYALVEAKRICNGVSEGTTAKITFQHGLIYDKMIKRFGYDKAYLYLEAQMKAMERYSKLCEKIACDYTSKDSYVYSASNREKIEKEASALEKLGINAKVLDTLQIPISIKGAVKVENQAQFHPLKFLLEISKDLNIYENTKVQELKPGKAITQNGEIEFKKIIIATHFPILNKHGAYFLKLYQHRSYVLALENAQNVDGMYVDENDKGMSFRNHKNVLLLGGGSHRTGKKGGSWKELEEFARINYPQSKIINKWSTQDCMTLDDIPYIGQYSKSTPNLFVATGFNKWGMTSSMVSAMILADLVQEKSNDYASVFSPSRTILRPQLAINTIESLLGLLTPTTPRCPHLGCALKYNPYEHSWDCPCHGSRFTKDGKLLNNPATDDKKSI